MYGLFKMLMNFNLEVFEYGVVIDLLGFRVVLNEYW